MPPPRSAQSARRNIPRETAGPSSDAVDAAIGRVVPVLPELSSRVPRDEPLPDPSSLPLLEPEPPPSESPEVPGTREELPRPFSERSVDPGVGTAAAPEAPDPVDGVALDEPPEEDVDPPPAPDPRPPFERGAASSRARSTGISYCAPAGLPASGSGDCGVWAPADAGRREAASVSTATLRRMSMAPSVGVASGPGPSPTGSDTGEEGGRRSTIADVAAASPVLLVGVFVLLTAWSQGAFGLRHWGPLALFALLALALAGSVRRLRGAPLVAVGALWAFVAWSLTSALWADSAGRALQGGARTALYAALFTLPVVCVPNRRVGRSLATVLVAGVGVMVLASYVAVLVDGPGMFLAGRLDDPVGYRNGTAALFALAFWPMVCVAAARHAPAPARALGFGVAVLALGLAFLTQSRGVLLGLLAGGAVAILLGPDRVRRAWLALFAAGLIAVASGSLLTPYDAFVDVRAATGDDIAVAARALGLTALFAVLAMAGLALLDNGIRLSDEALGLARGAAVGLLGLLCVVAAVGALAVVGNPFRYASDKVTEFKALETPGRQTRLGSTGGPRAEIYRVALATFRDAPLQGVGESSFEVRWYEQRRNDRNLSDAHSLPLGILAETGLVGGLLFLGFLLAVALALARTVFRLPLASRRWASALAAGGTVVIAQATVDWLWLIPGLAGLALLCIGLAVALGDSEPEEPAAPDPGARRPRSGAGLLALGPILVAVLVALLYLSNLKVQDARAERGTSPAAQLAKARTAETLNPFALAPRYLQAGALESLGRPGAARRELGDALELEPKSFVTLALLGDLELRAGDRGAARGFYRRALARNPIDTGLRELAAG